MDFNYIDRGHYLEDFKRLVKTVITTTGNLIKYIGTENEEDKNAEYFYYAYIPMYDLINYYPFIKRFLSKGFDVDFYMFIDKVQSLFSSLHLEENFADKSIFWNELQHSEHRSNFYATAEQAYKLFPEIIKAIEEELQKTR